MTARDVRSALAELPDALLAPAPSFAPSRRPRLVATGYGRSFRSSFSGSSHYLTTAGIAAGTLDGGFTLYAADRPDRGLQLRGAVWKARRVLARERPDGFKFAPEFSAHVWHRHLPALAGTDVVNNFQLFSPEVLARRAELGLRTAWYLDGTFTDYLLGYRAYDVAALDDATVRRAIAAEREGYAQGGPIAVMSTAVGSTLVEAYDVDPDRVEVVLPGANIDDATVARVAAGRADRPAGGEFIVGFVGVYPRRKGLPKLAEAVSRLRRQGVPVGLLVVGVCPPEIAAADGVEALGVLDKVTQAGEFAAALARIDLGAQLSTAEMWGIAVLEFVRCGIPVLATEVGGVPDMIPDGATVGVPAEAPVEQVAEAIRVLVEDPGAYARLAAEASVRSGDARWERTAGLLAGVWDRHPV